MQARIRESLAARKRDDQGFTLIELLVVVIIIGILAAIAIPVFLNQKSKAYDSSVKADLKSLATTAETYFTDNNNYGTATDGSQATAVFSATKSNGNSYHVIVFGGSQPGYIIYGQNTNSKHIYVLSSYSGTAPQTSSLTALPAASSTTISTETPTLNGAYTLGTATYSANF